METIPATETSPTVADTEPTPRVWVGCLAAYNGGRLHGEWVEVTDEDALWADIRRILASSPEPGAEEYFFADHENLPGIGEYTSVATIVSTADAVEEYGYAVVAAARGVFGDDYWLSSLQDGRYQGEATSPGDWAAERAEECGDDLGPYAQHIDWDSVARDVYQDYTFVEVAGTWSADGKRYIARHYLVFSPE